MAYLKDLKQAILEIPRLVEALKGQKPVPEKVQRPVPEKARMPVNTARYSEVKNSDGKALYYEGSVLRVGTPLLIESGNGKRTCPDGEYSTDAGRIMVKFGKVITVQSVSQAPAPRPAMQQSLPVARNEEFVQPRPAAAAEFNTQRENFEKKLAVQRDYFEKEINALKATLNSQMAALRASAESQNKTLKEVFALIDRISNAPSAPSEFRKKDGEPAEKSTNVFEEAKALSQKVFTN